jgi:hypothetical protein
MEHSKNSGSPDDPPPPAQGTGLFHKDGTEIPTTHPDHGPMHLIPRQEDGSIAAYYYCSKAELYDMQVPAPPPRRHRRHRRDGFTAERQAQFLDHVRGGASGREAARKVGISHTTAYNLYNSPDGAAFRAAWDEAAKVTDIVLEDTAVDRAVNGQEETVYHKGEPVGVRWKYDNNLLMKLLRARLPLKYAPLSEIEGWLRHRGIAPPADVEGALDRLRAAEAEWGSRLPGDKHPARLADETNSPDRSVRPEPDRSVRPELVEGPPPPSEEEKEDGPSTGSGRAEADADTPSLRSTSSTSPGTGQAEDPVDASMSSTSPGTGRAEDPADASMSSTSSGNGQDAVQPGAGADAPAPDDGSLIYYRPPPRPRLIAGP